MRGVPSTSEWKKRCQHLPLKISLTGISNLILRIKIDEESIKKKILDFSTAIDFI